VEKKRSSKEGEKRFYRFERDCSRPRPKSTTLRASARKKRGPLSKLESEFGKKGGEVRNRRDTTTHPR